MADIFISYRRDDAALWASHLCTSLQAVFGEERVFLDERGGLEGGDEYPAKLDEQVRLCRLFLAVIGPRWLDIADARTGTRRLDNPADWVRRETRSALARPHVLVPVLVGGAAMPPAASLPSDLTALADREAVEIKDGQYWDFGVAQVVKTARRRGIWTRTRRLATWLIVPALVLLAAASWLLFSADRAAAPGAVGPPPVDARALLSFRVLDPVPEGDVQLALERATGDIEGVEWVGAEQLTTFSVASNTKYRLTVSGPRIRNQLFDQPVVGRPNETQFYGLLLVGADSRDSHRLVGPARTRDALTGAAAGAANVQVASAAQLEVRLPDPVPEREAAWRRSVAAASVPVNPDLLRQITLLICGFETGSVVLDSCWFALSGNYAGEGLSLGYLQWNLRARTLQPLLRQMNARHPDVMRAALGAANHAALMSVLAEPDDVPRQVAWADSIQDQQRHTVNEPWRSAFRRLAAQPEFQDIMVAATAPLFTRALGLARDYDLRSERGLAFMFNVVVNMGTMPARVKAEYETALQALSDRAGRRPDEAERMELLAEKRVPAAMSPMVRRHVLDRMLTIARGRGAVGGVTYDLDKLRITLAPAGAS